MGRYPEAIDMLQGMLTTSGASVSFDPIEVRYRLALVQVAAAQLSEAAATLQQVVQAKPDHAEAHVYLGSIYYRLGQYGSGLAACPPGRRVRRSGSRVACNTTPGFA